MQRENVRRILTTVVIVAAIVVAIALVFYIVRSLFFGGNGPTETQVTNPLLNTSVNRGVRMDERGMIVADEKFRSISIDVTPTARSLTIYQGYNGTVLNKKVYNNSQNAYEQFVYALDQAHMTKSRTTPNDDTRGVCAMGQLYTFSLENDTDTESSLWTSTCAAGKGTLDASASTLKQLFNAQIPDYFDLVGNVIL